MTWLTTIFLIAVCPCSSAFATTKGLSQIVTPELQKLSELSVSYQQQSLMIGNPEQVQFELGLTPWLEGAVFQGFDPSEAIFGSEVSLLQKEPYLLSAGVINFSTKDRIVQPFVESGFYRTHDKWIVGATYANSETELLLGFAYDFDVHWRAQIDFQSGTQNFSTVGFTYTYDERFQFNPALYMSNDPARSLAGYIVFSYSISIWQPKTIPSSTNL